MPLPEQPPRVVQPALTLSATSQQSAPFGVGTTLIEITLDGIAHLLVGAPGTVATVSCSRYGASTESLLPRREGRPGGGGAHAVRPHAERLVNDAVGHADATHPRDCVPVKLRSRGPSQDLPMPDHAQLQTSIEVQLGQAVRAVRRQAYAPVDRLEFLDWHCGPHERRYGLGDDLGQCQGDLGDHRRSDGRRSGLPREQSAGRAPRKRCSLGHGCRVPPSRG